MQSFDRGLCRALIEACESFSRASCRALVEACAEFYVELCAEPCAEPHAGVQTCRRADVQTIVWAIV